MKNEFNDDHNILEALRSKVPLQVNAALKYLLLHDKLRASVRKQVQGIGGDANDAREVLSQALVVFFNQVENGKYDPALSSIRTYVVKIATQLYFTRRRSDMRRVAMYDRSVEAGAIETETNPELEMNFQHRKELLDKILAATGEKCHKALRLQSFNFSMAEIAAKMGYKNADVAKMAIQDCKKKLNKFIAERPDLLAELREI